MDNRYMSFALKVANPFPGWNWMLRRELENIGGLSYYIDSEGIVHVSGKIRPYLMVDMLAKAGIHAEICQISGAYSHMNKALMHGNGYGYYYGEHGPSPYTPYGSMNYYWHNPQLRYWHHHYPYYPYY